MKTHLRSRRSSILALAAAFAVTDAAHAANVTWDKGAGTLNWADAANWSSDKLPGTTDVAQFFAAGISAGDVIDAGGNVAIQQIQLGNTNVANNPPDFTLANVPGSKITLSGGGTGNLLAIQKGTQTSGVVTIISDLEFNPSVAGVTALTVNSQGTGGGIVITGSISDAGRGIGLLLNGGKPLTLSGANTYSGITTIQRNNIILGADAPAGAPGALGNSTSAIGLGNASTTATQNVGLLTSGAFTVGRDISVYPLIASSEATIGGQSSQTVGSVFSGTITLNHDALLQSYTTGTDVIDFTGKLTGSYGIFKTSAGAIRLSNPTSDYTGDTTLRNGTTILAADAPSGSPGVLGNSSNSIIVGNANTSSTGTISLFTAGPYTIARGLTVNVTPSTGPVTIGALPTQTVSSLYSGNITLNRDVQLQSTTTSGNAVQFSGHITGVGSITKTGSGAVLLSSASGNDYTGATTVAAGSLLINTTHTGGGTYVVQSGATLGGTGSITGPLGVNDGGVLAPGASIGSFTVGGDVTLDGLLDIGLDPSGPGAADALNVSGTLTLSATSKLRFPDSIVLDDAAYIFASYSSLVGIFDPANISGIPAGYSVEYAYNGNQIALVNVDGSASVPEPAAMAPLMLLAAITIRRRRHL